MINMDTLAQKAIEEALKGNWSEAESLNENILEQEPNNREALNRLARACLELGKIKKSLSSYKKVLKIDPYNSIAQKAIGRLEALENNPLSKEKFKKKANGNGLSPVATANLFIEEPGKTKTVSLIHLGDATVISIIDAGEQVVLSPHAHRVSVETEEGRYIGRFPDDVSRRLIKFCRGGYEYQSYVKSVTADSVKIFVRETKRADNMTDIPSFPSTEKPNYVSFTSPDSIHEERPDVLTPEEQEDRV
jgi:tetratricopeptide (TPR) repeat protein